MGALEDALLQLDIKSNSSGLDFLASNPEMASQVLGALSSQPAQYRPMDIENATNIVEGNNPSQIAQDMKALRQLVAGGGQQSIPQVANSSAQLQQPQVQLQGQPTQVPTNVSQPQSGGNSMALIQKYFPQNQWATAYAVMMAESGGRPEAIGDNYPIKGQTIPSYGLFQIRALKGRPDPKVLSNPEENVKYAAQMWKSQGWQPWSAYKNGSYKRYLK